MRSGPTNPKMGDAECSIKMLGQDELPKCLGASLSLRTPFLLSWGKRTCGQQVEFCCGRIHSETVENLLCAKLLVFHTSSNGKPACFVGTLRAAGLPSSVGTQLTMSLELEEHRFRERGRERERERERERTEQGLIERQRWLFQHTGDAAGLEKLFQPSTSPAVLLSQMQHACIENSSTQNDAWI